MNWHPDSLGKNGFAAVNETGGWKPKRVSLVLKQLKWSKSIALACLTSAVDAKRNAQTATADRMERWLRVMGLPSWRMCLLGSVRRIASGSWGRQRPSRSWRSAAVIARDRRTVRRSKL